MSPEQRNLNNEITVKTPASRIFFPDFDLSWSFIGQAVAQSWEHFQTSQICFVENETVRGAAHMFHNLLTFSARIWEIG